MAKSANIKLAPIEAAMEIFGAKSIVASTLRSAAWAKVPAAIRDRAQFSAGVASARMLSAIQNKISGRLAVTREAVARGEAFIDRSSFIKDIRQIVREEGLGTGRGDLTDLQSRARLGLIFDMQVQQAQNFARWKIDQEPDLLDAYPAQELIRIEDRVYKRNWPARWQSAGGRLINDRMVALKTDPIWFKISRFGNPWPPFDFGSGMGLEDISRAEAEGLGLIEPSQKLLPRDIDFNERLETDIAGIAPELLTALARTFGNSIQIAEGKLRWIAA